MASFANAAQIDLSELDNVDPPRGFGRDYRPGRSAASMPAGPETAAPADTGATGRRIPPAWPIPPAPSQEVATAPPPPPATAAEGSAAEAEQDLPKTYRNR